MHSLSIYVSLSRKVKPYVFISVRIKHSIIHHMPGWLAQILKKKSDQIQGSKIGYRW